jgi:hypothetical protein
MAATLGLEKNLITSPIFCSGMFASFSPAGFPRERILLENYRFSFLPVSRKKVVKKVLISDSWAELASKKRRIGSYERGAFSLSSRKLFNSA